MGGLVATTGSPTGGAGAFSFSPPPLESEDVAIALHEASHVVAAALLGRRVEGVAIDLDGGHAAIASLNSLDTIPDAVTLEHVLDDLTVWLVGNEGINRCLHRPPSMIDEDRANDLAHKVTADVDEAVALVQLGRMKARTLATSPAFVALVQPVADRLLERGSLTGDEVAAILNDYEGATNGQAS